MSVFNRSLLSRARRPLVGLEPGWGESISVCIHLATERERGIISVAGGVFLCCSMMCVGDGIGIISVVIFVMNSCAMA